MTETQRLRHAGGPPAVGFIGWGPESRAMLEALAARHPGIEQAACALAPAGGGPAAPLARQLPAAEDLFAEADTIFVEGGMPVLEPHLAMVRLAISDRHVLALLGPGWSLQALLEPLHERKLVRCVLLPSETGRLSTLAYCPTPYLAPEDTEAFRGLVGPPEQSVEVREEAHIDVLHGLADFAPAAFATALEAMADGVVMTGLARPTALRFLAALLHQAAGQVMLGEATPAELREQALEREVTAAGLVELEAAGLRGILMRALERAVRTTQPPGPRRTRGEPD